MHESLLDPKSTDDAHLPLSFFCTFAEHLSTAAVNHPDAFDSNTPPLDAIRQVLSIPVVASFLIAVSRVDVFAPAATAAFDSSHAHLAVLRAYKLLKFCYSLPIAQLLTSLTVVVDALCPGMAAELAALTDRVLGEQKLASMFMKHVVLSPEAPASLRALYQQNADKLISIDPHAIFPTSVYRTSFGHCASTDDHTVIEAVMGTSITTTIQIVRDVLHPTSSQLRDVYKPLGRCVAVIDQLVDNLYGKDLNTYFEAHGILLEKLIYRCMEVDKDISTVQRILVDLKKARVSRNEPVLVVGGGVMADVGSFACALYHRNTPYVMLCTSIVSGIDAGPSPRSCCDGLGYKNVFGAYHPPVLTLTDRAFFQTLRPGWIRHGIAEIIKMAVTKDGTLFSDLEVAGQQLVDTKFGIENCERGSDIDQLSQNIIAKAMDGYVRSEYGNLWETHQCRPHAYGHTWSPGFELQAGLLHGHAVAIGMGFGAYLSFVRGWISKNDFERILSVMSAVGLSLRHDILNNTDSIWSSQVKMTEKRGGNLCAPVPKGNIGQCGYINDVSREELIDSLEKYQKIVSVYPREGYGIEAHCADVGLEDPSTVKQHAENAVGNGSISKSDVERDAVEEGDSRQNQTNIDTYNAWIENAQKERNLNETSSALGMKLVTATVAKDKEHPPTFTHSTLFHTGAEEYASAMTTVASPDFVRLAEETVAAGLFAPCMVGHLEGQFLTMITGLMGAKRVLDIGTFTGYSALSFAKGVGAGGEVVSLEADAKTAAVARKCLAGSKEGAIVRVVECDARTEVTKMVAEGELFDIVFLDADKVNYKHYYEAGIHMVKDGGVLMADNALCSLLYEDGDEAKQALHEFATMVRSDSRVEQVMVTVREGIMMVRKLSV